MQLLAPWTTGSTPVPYAPIVIGSLELPLFAIRRLPVQMLPRLSSNRFPGSRGAEFALASVFHAAVAEAPVLASLPPTLST
jgi:hypothetical protein